MRKRRSEEEIRDEQEPIMYTKSQLRLVDGLRSSFPSWRRAGFFDWRAGWTKLGDYFADGVYLREEMRELVHNRYGVQI